MEIDIFPIPHRKEGIARNFDKGFLGILIITYIIAAFKTAQWIVGNDAGKEFVCFLLTIPIFVGYYALFVLVCHGIKTGLKVRGRKRIAWSFLTNTNHTNHTNL